MTETKVFRIDPENIDYDKIRYCADVIKRGGLVCFPTETVYGLGASAFDEVAVENIFKAKGRPNDNPLIVHVCDNEMIENVADAPDYQMERLEKMAARFWPGPLTMIVDKNGAIPDAVSCGLATVGIRMPVNKIALALIRESGVPIAAPSANLSGKPSPTTFEHCEQDLMGRVDVIIDGGPCDVGVESTVLDLVGENPSILRPGAITLENVRETLGENSDLFDWQKPLGDVKPKSPGMKYTHYSPDADVTIYDGDIEKVREFIKKETEKLIKEGETVGILHTDDATGYYDKGFAISFGDRKAPLTLTRNLFDALRTFDKFGCTVVLAEAVDKSGVGNAVMNRLYRAAGGKIITIK